MWFHSGAPCGRRLRTDARGFTGTDQRVGVGELVGRLCVVAFIRRVHSGSQFRNVVFILGRLVHSGSRWGSLTGSLGSLMFALGVEGFIRGRWVHSWGSLGSSGAVGFTKVRTVRRRVHPGLLGLALGGVAFLRGRWFNSGSTGIIGFSRFCLRGSWIHSGSPRGALG